MKKRLLAILMATAMSMSFIACGGSKDEGTTNNNAAVENNAASTESAAFSDEQIALAEEYLELIEVYDATVERVNATPELLENQELVDLMNEVTDAIVDADECFEDPELLTDEVMAELRKAFDYTYEFIDQVNELVGEAGVAMEDLADVFTIGYVGMDEEENTYYFISDEDIVSAGFVYLSADATQHLICIGDTVDNEDGSFTIVDAEDGLTATLQTVEQIEGGLVLSIDGEIEVTMVPYDAAEVLEMITTIETETQNISE